MESYTTQTMIDTAKKIAREITEKGNQFGCSECIVDDYGNFGNFALICYLKVKHNHNNAYSSINKNDINLTLLVNIIKKVINSHNKSGAIKRSHECPKGVYKSNSYRGMRFKPDFLGYEKSYIYIDLDFIPYHEATNTFAVQKKNDLAILDDKKYNQLKLF